jgi:ribosomal protein S27AE
MEEVILSGVNCPMCGGALFWVSERFFCPKCSIYPEIHVSDWGAFFDDFDLVCSSCGSSLDFIEQYDRLFCVECKKYPDE